MVSQEEFNYKLELLRDEISVIQGKISDFDSLSFRIKGWAITLWTAISGIAIREMSAHIAAIALPVLMAFWMLDGYFKSYQQRSMQRMGYIEGFLNPNAHPTSDTLSDAFEHRDFGSFIIFDPIGRQTRDTDGVFRARYEEKTNLWRCLWRINNVRILYLSLIAVTLAGIAIIEFV
jgi:hypothetical protein